MPPIPQHTLRRRAALHAITLALAATPAAFAQSATPGTAAAAASTRDYDIPGGALDEVLKRYGDAAGVAVSADRGLTAARSSAGVKGRYGVADGFAVALAGTGLQALPRADGSFELRDAGATPAAVVVSATDAAAAGAVAPASGDQVLVSSQAFSDSTVIVNRRQIEEQQPRDTRETLQNETGVAVGGGGNAIAQKVYAREIEDTMLIITLDGVPQGGNVFHHQGRVLIDPAMMKRIEVDKGGTLASVGPGGLAGSVRMTTKDARDLLLPGRSFGALALGGVESNDGWAAGAALFGTAASDTVDYVGYLQRRNTADYEDGHGNVQSNTAAEQISGLAKGNWRIAPLHQLSLSYLTLQDEGVRYPRPHMTGFPGSNTPMPQKLDQSTWTAGWRYDGEGKLPAAELVLFSDDVENKRTNGGNVPVFGKPPGATFGEKLETLGANLLLTSMLGSTPLRYGLNYQDREASAINPTRSGFQGNTSKETADVIGVFAETSLPFGGIWTLDLGARYDWYGYDDNHGQSYSSNGLSPNANLTVKLAQPLALWAGISSTLRGVGPKEIFMLDNGPGPYIYRNAPDLDPERANNYELGLLYDDGTWSLKGSVFQMVIDDYLGLVFNAGPPASAIRENVGKVRSNGFELGGGWRSGPLRIDLSVADARPKLNGYDLGDGDFSLGTTIGVTWLTAVRYEIPEWNLVMGWNGRFVQDVEYTPAGATAPARKAGYGVNDIYLSWLPTGQDTVRVGFGVRNLFNQFYYDQASYGFSTDRGMFLGYPDPGRNVWVNVAWRF